MLETLHQTAEGGDYQRTDAGDSIIQQMQETLYQTVDAGDSLSDSGGRRLSIRQRMQETPYQTADAGDSIRQRMQESL